MEPAFERLAALYSLAFEENHRSDRLSDGVGDYVEREFIRQRNFLGDKCIDNVSQQYAHNVSFLIRALGNLSSDIPLVSILWLAKGLDD